MEDRKYLWRRLTEQERSQVLRLRREGRRPWHSPPRSSVPGKHQFHLYGACFNHAPIIGTSQQRIESFTEEVLNTINRHATHVFAWCMLPNHYHALTETAELDALAKEMGQLHGRTSFKWNGEDNLRSRKCFYRMSDRRIRSEGHFWATVNYIHNNPVHHGYCDKWTDWPWSSAAAFLEEVGREEAERIWREYPVRDYGRGWDDSSL